MRVREAPLGTIAVLDKPDGYLIKDVVVGDVLKADTQDIDDGHEWTHVMVGVNGWIMTKFIETVECEASEEEEAGSDAAAEAARDAPPSNGITTYFGNEPPHWDPTTADAPTWLLRKVSEAEDASQMKSEKQRAHFRFIQVPCCGQLLCRVNPRLPNYCPECEMEPGPSSFWYLGTTSDTR